MHNPTRQVQDPDRRKNKAVLKELPDKVAVAAAALARAEALEPAEALAQPEAEVQAAAWEQVPLAADRQVQELQQLELPEAEALPITTVVWVQQTWVPELLAPELLVAELPEAELQDRRWEPVPAEAWEQAQPAAAQEAPELAQLAAAQEAWEPDQQEAAHPQRLLNQVQALALLLALPDHRAQ
jgi:hypothetical protein